MCVNTRVLISICVEVAPNADVGPYNTCVEPSILVVKEMVVVDTPVVGVMEENWRVELHLLIKLQLARRYQVMIFRINQRTHFSQFSK